jgi:hypothetical protein
VTQSIAEKIDELLADDSNFDTRTGLRFMTELVKSAFEYIEDEKKKQSDTDALQGSIITRITNVENGLNEFLKMRKAEQERNETERSKWRLAILSPTILLVVGELVKWFFSR